MSGPPPASTFTVSAVLPTSADPRIASENFTSDRVAAIVTITGRFIGPLSRHPDEREIAILPGTLLTPVGEVTVAGLPSPVVLLAEPGHAPGLPVNQEELERVVVEQITHALACPAAPIHSPGRFTPPAGRDSAPPAATGAATLVDNIAVRRAVADFSAEPGQRRLFDVLRACMYGELLFDITGSDTPVDGAFAANSRLQIRCGTGRDGRRALFAFTSNAEIARMHPPGTRTQSMVTPATGALELVRSQGDGWLYIDPAGPTCALSAEEIDFALRNPRNEPLKAVLAEHHTRAASREDVLAVLRQDGPLMLAADDTTVTGKVGIRSLVMADGSTALLGFTSAPEVVAYNASVAVAPATTSQVLDMVRKDGYSGLVVNPAGPQIAVPAAVLG
ncbi:MULTISPECIES: SseB family protein [unclassified Mycolicibacterium]|uniref:SseB family protein n=1 Tax=unclassified Mycolicibacterium TaxID=2636767 RepID=UPI0012DFC211|nr:MULTISPECIES: SseB family protein [unclassified Mycolicibacterium]MUL81544.1 SseB family protein [Mycolicibacterium sp. CBMA 329]MUL87310.1 SseB family protein [Mycolicibacterium sp. CBMA 331]MUM02597.1 SseB family protein [Mycolicibacterium sp. CBMA 334]MUM25168.1 SseB family protein [Mycolicibacterium sp. CBMA 295]MUM37607.1 SseB family protein [Mycolicibacterium sp. CBMA 247]